MTATNMCSNFGGFRSSPPKGWASLNVKLHADYVTEVWMCENAISDQNGVDSLVIQFP